MDINGYTLKSELQNANSGFSKWGFATKKGKEYFIKELINPVYPIDRSIMTLEMLEQRRKFCAQYENKFKEFYDRINKASRGNLVRIEEFFRYGSKYYLITEKVDGKPFSVEYISSLDDDKKLLLIKTVAHCFNDLHSAGIVHFDVKPNNILVKTTKTGNYVAKLIDFDSGFFKGEVLDNKELGGDLTYLAPETFLGIYGEDVHPDEKADIFGLGLVFHQYYCGILPYYDETEYEYPFEAALDGGLLKPDTDMMPDDIAKLITSMLDADPNKRPSAKDIICRLNEMNADESLANIKSIFVHFNGYYGKSICIQENKIQYRNTIHPVISGQTKNFPDSYTKQLERSITSDVFANIIDEISAAGLFDIVDEHINRQRRPESVYSSVSVTFVDGMCYEYLTCGTPDPRFKQITKLLSKHCDFPLINPEWYDNCDGVHSDSLAHVAASRTNPQKEDWFKPAGDL